MKRTRRSALISMVLAGAAVGVAACTPPPEEEPPAARIETVSLRVEGMT